MNNPMEYANELLSFLRGLEDLKQKNKDVAKAHKRSLDKVISELNAELVELDSYYQFGFTHSTRRASIRNDSDFIAKLREIEPLLKKYDYKVVTEDLRGYSDPNNDDAMDDWKMSRDEFYDFLRYMDAEGLLKFLSQGEEVEDERTGRILNVYPDLYETDYRAVQKYLKKHSRRASWDDDEGDEEEYYRSREDDFFEYLMDADWDFQSEFIQKDNVSYDQAVKLGRESIRIFQQIKRAYDNYGKLLIAYDDTQDMQSTYYEKGQMGKWSIGEKRLDKLSKEIDKAENTLEKLYSKYGRIPDWMKTVEDFVADMYLTDRAGTLEWSVSLQWDLRADEWDTDIDPGDFVDSPI